MTDRLDPFTTGYVETMLWLATDEDGDPLDLEFSDVAPATLAAIVRDCADFQAANADDLSAYYGGDSRTAGGDFYLTRNRHGAGYWDRDYSDAGAPVMARLTEAAHVYGETWEYLGDDGLLYTSGGETWDLGDDGLLYTSGEEDPS